VNDPDLTTEENAPSSRPGFRCLLGGIAARYAALAGRHHPVCFDEIVDALRSLDSGPLPKSKRVLRRERPGSNENPDGGFQLAKSQLATTMLTDLQGGRTLRCSTTPSST